MADAALRDVLIALEVELHRPPVRADRARMQALLHAEFFEIGRSGRHWSREATLDEFADAATAAAASTVAASDFALHCLGDTLALLTYRSVYTADDGQPHRATLRSSLWQRSPDGRWQLRFHQGTPAQA